MPCSKADICKKVCETKSFYDEKAWIEKQTRSFVHRYDVGPKLFYLHDAAVPTMSIEFECRSEPS